MQTMNPCRHSHNIYLYYYSLYSFRRQVVVILTQLEGNDGFSVSHKLSFRTMIDNGDGDYGAQHMPELGQDLIGLHSPRPITYNFC